MGTAAVLENDDPTWKGDALQLIAKVAESGEAFDAYTLETVHGLRPPRHPNQWGMLFRTAASADIITYIGHQRSARPGRKGSMCAVWRGLPNDTYGKAAA